MHGLGHEESSPEDLGAVTVGLATFRRDALRRFSLAYVAWLVVAGVACYVVYSAYGEDPDGAILPSLLLYGVVSVVHVGYRVLYTGRAVALAPDLVVLLTYTLFHLGYVTLYGLDLVPFLSWILFFPSAVPESLFVINVGLVSFLLGFELLGSGKGRAPPCRQPVSSSDWAGVGTVLLVAAVGLHLVALVLLGADYLAEHAYVGIQRTSRYASYSLGLLFAVSTLCYLTGVVIHCGASALQKRRLFSSRIALGATLGLMALFLLEGDRLPLLDLGIIIILVRQYLLKPFSPWVLLGVVLASLFIFAALREVRSSVILDPSAMLEEYEYQTEAEELTWKAPFVEMGGSFVAVNITVHEVPDRVAYWNGASWASAVMHAVPFAQGVLSARGLVNESPSVWVTESYFGERAAGRGFTLAAEGYLNLGVLGVILELGAVGLSLRWLMRRFAVVSAPHRGMVFLVAVAIMTAAVRQHLNLIIAPIVYAALLAYLLHRLLDRVRPTSQTLS
jgi:hypothetical protein